MGINRKMKFFCELLFAIYGIYGVYLAFDKPQYNPFFAYLMKWDNYLCAFLGIVVVFLVYQKVSKQNIMLALLPCLYLVLLVFDTYGGYRGSWLISFMTCFSFCLFDNETKKDIFLIFFKLIIAICGIAILLQISYYTKLINFDRVLYYSENSERLGKYYAKFWIFAIYEGVRGSIYLPRACGIFNEPGGFGTIIGIVFCASLPYSNRYEKIAMIIAGVMTFSFAFYLLILFTYGLRLIVRNKKYMVGIIPLIVCILFLPNIDFHNEQLNHIAHRFTLSSTGFAGDNRTTPQFDEEYSRFLRSDKIFWGNGYGYNSTQVGTSSYKMIIYYFGFVGFAVLILFWVWNALYSSQKNKDAYIYTIVFFMSLYQRPGAIASPMGYIVLFGGIQTLIKQHTICIREDVKKT